MPQGLESDAVFMSLLLSIAVCQVVGKEGQLCQALG